MSDVEKKDTQFVPILITEKNGRKHTAFLYKPQNLVCTSYITVELLKSMGCNIEEVDRE